MLQESELPFLQEENKRALEMASRMQDELRRVQEASTESEAGLKSQLLCVRSEMERLTSECVELKHELAKSVQVSSHTCTCIHVSAAKHAVGHPSGVMVVP